MGMSARDAEIDYHIAILSNLEWQRDRVEEAHRALRACSEAQARADWRAKLDDARADYAAVRELAFQRGLVASPPQ